METTSRSALGPTSDHSPLQSDSIVNAVAGTDSGPKTERAVGVVALASGFMALTLFLISVYRIVQLLSN